MFEVFSNIYDLIMNTIDILGPYGPILGCILIIFESILPMLPLFVFITLNCLAFGKIVGFFISWICTVIGCLLSYFLTKKFLANYFYRKFKNNELFVKTVHYLENLSVQKLTVILAIPFTPAFMVNIAGGIAKVDFKKFFVSILIGKIFLVLFWGEIGTGLVESFKNPENLVYVLIMTIVAYIISSIINKIFKLN